MLTEFISGKNVLNNNGADQGIYKLYSGY